MQKDTIIHTVDLVNGSTICICVVLRNHFMYFSRPKCHSTVWSYSLQVFFWKMVKYDSLNPKSWKTGYLLAPPPHTLPPPERTWYQGYHPPDRLKTLPYLWKLYLPATSFAVGRNANANANAISPWRIEFCNSLQNGTSDACHNTQKFFAGGSLAKLAYYSTVPQKRFSIVETNKVTISLKLFWSMFWCDHLSICALMRGEFFFL